MAIFARANAARHPRAAAFAALALAWVAGTACGPQGAPGQAVRQSDVRAQEVVVKGLEKQLQDKGKELSELKSKLDQIDLSSDRTELGDLDRQIGAQQENLSRLAAERDTARQRSFEQWAQRDYQAGAALAAQKERVRQLETALGEAQRRQQAAARYLAEQEAMNMDTPELSSARAAYSASSSQVQALQNQLAQAQAQLGGATELAGQAEKFGNESREQSDRDYQAVYDQGAATLKSLQSRYDDLQKKTQAAQQSQDQLTQQYNAARDEHEELQSRAAAERRKLDQMRALVAASPLPAST